MYFKNVIAMQLSEFPLTAEQLNEKMGKFLFSKLSGRTRCSIGWASPLGGDNETLAYPHQELIAFTYRSDSRSCPTNEIKRRTDERIEELLEKGESINKETKLSIEEDIESRILPAMPISSKVVSAFIDIKSNLIFIDTKTPGTVEDVLALLRKTIGSLIVKPVMVCDWIGENLSHWICHPESDIKPEKLWIPHSANALVKDKLDKVFKMNFSNVDLFDDVIKNTIDNRLVTSLSLALKSSQKDCHDLIGKFTLNATSENTFSLSKIDFIYEEEKQLGEEDHHWLGSNLSVMAGLFETLIPTLIEGFGGTDSIVE